jgi:serralysin
MTTQMTTQTDIRLPAPISELVEVESNDTIATAQYADISGSGIFATFFSGNNPNLSASLDVDLFRIELNADEQLNASAFSFSSFPPPVPAVTSDISPIPPPPFFSLDLTLRLFDAEGNPLAIAYDDQNGSIDPVLSYIAATAGTYYIGVSNLGNDAYDPSVEGSGSTYGESSGSYNISLFKSLPNEVIGTDDDDSLDGTYSYDLIRGQAGDDTIQSFEDTDRLFGGAGDDTLLAGDGDDRAFGEKGNDLLLGGDGIDWLEGNEGNDRLFGENGNDTLYGDQGNDSLNGGEGSDILYGGDGRDILDGSLSSDTLYGEAGNDTLRGGEGYDTLDGGDGNDTLIGGGTQLRLGGDGEDVLTGGKGKDLFILGDRERVYYDDGDPEFYGEFDRAIITDFNAKDDRIQLKGSADLYSLDFYRMESGNLGAALIYDPGIESRGETIAILENVDATLSIKNAAFTFV